MPRKGDHLGLKQVILGILFWKRIYLCYLRQGAEKNHKLWVQCHIWLNCIWLNCYWWNWLFLVLLLIEIFKKPDTTLIRAEENIFLYNKIELLFDRIIIIVWLSFYLNVLKIFISSKCICHIGVNHYIWNALLCVVCRCMWVLSCLFQFTTKCSSASIIDITWWVLKIRWHLICQGKCIERGTGLWIFCYNKYKHTNFFP